MLIFCNSLHVTPHCLQNDTAGKGSTLQVHIIVFSALGCMAERHISKQRSLLAVNSRMMKQEINLHLEVMDNCAIPSTSYVLL